MRYHTSFHGTLPALLAVVVVLLHGAQGVSDRLEKLNKRVVVVAGLAGSGTRTIYSLLDAAGVWMHPQTNAMLASHIPTFSIKETAAFGLPGTQSGLIWETRHTPACYNASELTWPLRNAMHKAHLQFARNILTAVPDEVEVWGFKAPEAIFILPFLIGLFPNIHIIHQVRDGRDVALSNLRGSRRMASPYQRHYIQTVTGRNFTDEQLSSLAYSKAVAAFWASVNTNAKKWATEHGLGVSGQYSITRLEDFCNPATVKGAIAAMLSHANISATPAVISKAAATIEFGKCNTNRWETAGDSADQYLATAIDDIDAQIAGALEAFYYTPQTFSVMPIWPEAAEAMANLQEAALQVATRSGQVLPLILTDATHGYELLVENWLDWLDAAHVDLTRVFIISKGESTAAVRKIVAGRGPFVFDIPNFEAPAIMAKRTDPVESSHVTGVWIDRTLVLYELVTAGIPVMMSDLDAIWLQNALDKIEAMAASHPTGYDFVFSQGRFPFQISELLTTAACMGLAFINATATASAVLWRMLNNMQSNVKFDDQEAMNQQLLWANLVVNMSNSENDSGNQHGYSQSIEGTAWTSYPDSMRVLFLPRLAYQRECVNATLHSGVVAHCRSKKTADSKVHAMRSMGLWKANLD